MNNKIIEFPQIELVEEQAASWLTAMDRGLCAEEQGHLESWLQESSLHAETFLELAVFWDKADALSVISRVIPVGDVASFDPGRPSTEVAAKKQRAFGYIGMAAGFVLLVMVSAFLTSNYLGRSHVYFEQMYQTTLGQQKTVQLPDGTEITLNTSSQIFVRYSKKIRSVTLSQGEAYFDVATNPQAPFVVSVDQATVTAVGTAFNIHRTQTGYQVLVTEGTVAVNDSLPMVLDGTQSNSSSDGISRHISVGQRLLVENQVAGALNRVDDDTMQAALAWRDGMLLFRGETLKQALKEINRYSSTQLIIEDESIESVTVGGLFRADDTEQILSILEYNFGLVSRQVGDKLFLSRR